jgi:hypothetical protein
MPTRDFWTAHQTDPLGREPMWLIAFHSIQKSHASLAFSLHQRRDFVLKAQTSKIYGQWNLSINFAIVLLVIVIFIANRVLSDNCCNHGGTR